VGLADRARQAAQQMNAGAGALQPGRPADPSPLTPSSAGPAACPGKHYETEVNKHDINMGRWESKLNSRYQRGYRLAHVFEQNGNTVMVWEHHFHS
jgi:hypothetical protein